MKYKIYSNLYGDLSDNCDECIEYRTLLKPYTIILNNNLYLNSLININLIISAFDHSNFKNKLNITLDFIKIIPQTKQIIIHEKIYNTRIH